MGAFDFADMNAWGKSNQRVVYSSPSSGVTSGMQSLVDMYNSSYQEAKSRNEALYNQMMGLSNQYLSSTNDAAFDTSGLYKQALGEVSNLSGQRAADIRSDSERQRSNAMQQLARTGMSNTTIAPTLSMGFEREKQSSLNRLADEMAEQRAGILQNQATAQLSGASAKQAALGSAYNTSLDVMGKYGREAYPDLSSLQSILTGVSGQYGGGQGIQALLEALGKVQQ